MASCTKQAGPHGHVAESMMDIVLLSIQEHCSCSTLAYYFVVIVNKRVNFWKSNHKT
jgi:antibiotic biosynthesis monooxygenase (ABM) superfamily enzyme